MPKDLLYQGSIFVKKSPVHGYGVFAAKNFAAGEVVEECHTLLTSTADPELMNHYFLADKLSALPLGYGCIYNHSDTPNVDYVYHPDSGLIIFTAIKTIPEGEEIFSSYGQEWFSNRNLTVKATPWWRQVYRRSLGLPLRAALILGGFLALIQGLKYLSS